MVQTKDNDSLLPFREMTIISQFQERPPLADLSGEGWSPGKVRTCSSPVLQRWEYHLQLCSCNTPTDVPVAFFLQHLAHIWNWDCKQTLTVQPMAASFYTRELSLKELRDNLERRKARRNDRIKEQVRKDRQWNKIKGWKTKTVEGGRKAFFLSLTLLFSIK